MSLFPAYGDAVETASHSECLDDEQDKLPSDSYRSYPVTLSYVATLSGQQSTDDRLLTNERKHREKICETKRSKRKAIRHDADSSLSSDENPSTKHHKKEHKEEEKYKRHKRKKNRKHEKEVQNRDDNISQSSKHISRSCEVEISKGCLEHSCISQLPASDKVFIEEVLSLLKTPHAFTIDRKPDKDNLSYDCIYRTKIARYHTFGSSKTQSKKRKAAKKPEATSGRYFSSKERKGLEVCDKLPSRLVTGDFPQNEFISLEICSSSEITRISSENATAIQGQRDSEIRKKVEENDRLLREDPHNEDTWLEFVEFQKTAVCPKQAEQRTKDDVDDWLKVDGKTLIEIRSAILDKAVEKNASSKALRFAQLELNETLWDLEKLSQEWRKLVFSFANDPDVWFRYIRFAQCNFSVFTVSRVVGIYSKCLMTLDAIHRGTMTSHGKLPNTVEHMIEIFGQLCTFLSQSGHTEKAVALFQAQLEYSLFCPSMLQDVDKSDQMDFLSAFWDSGVPRFGEVNAVGWDAWVNNKGMSAASSGSVNVWSSKERDEAEEEKLINDHGDQCKLWLAVECSRVSRHWLPWRQSSGDAEDEDECEDTERIVLFEDISKCLFFVRSTEHRFAILSAFYNFLDRLYKVKQFSRNPLVFSSTSMENASEIYKYCDAKLLFETHLSAGSCLENYALFRENVLKQVCDKFEGEFRTFLYLRDVDFRGNQLECCDDDGDRKLKSKELKKFIKSLLNVERNNLAIWQRYAAFEFHNGNHKDARKVFDTAIKMSGIENVSKIKSYEACVKCLLYRTYASLELGVEIDVGKEKMFHTGKKRDDKGCDRSGKVSRPLCIVVALGDSSGALLFDASIASTRMLKCKRYYSQNLDALMEQFDSVTEETASECLLRLPYVGDTLVHWISCYALLQYLTAGVEAMSTVFDNTLSRLSSSYDRASKAVPAVMLYRQIVHQMCTESYIGILRYHVSNYMSPLSTLRMPLMSCLGRFHESRCLLQSFVDLESAFSIAGHLRRYFHENMSLAKTPVLALFAALSEFKRIRSLKLQQTDTLCAGVVETGVTNQLRAWFEAAVNHPASQHCILIWRLYLYFEVQMNNENNVKTVFYRALQWCPWAKSIYLDCVRYVPEMLQEVNDLLTEKELKIRTPLEELALLMSGKQTLMNERPADETGPQNEEQNDAMQIECNL